MVLGQKVIDKQVLLQWALPRTGGEVMLLEFEGLSSRGRMGFRRRNATGGI